jgi:hypothetical protein
MYEQKANIFIFTNLIELLFEQVSNNHKKLNYRSYKKRSYLSAESIEVISDKFYIVYIVTYLYSNNGNLDKLRLTLELKRCTK